MRDEPRTDRRPRKRGVTRLPGLGALGEETRVGGPRGGPGTHIRLSIKFISIRAKHEYVRSGWGSLDVFVSNMPKIHHIMENNENMHVHAETNTARQLYALGSGPMISKEKTGSGSTMSIRPGWSHGVRG